jgi:prolyl oligopeptidase
MRNSLPVAVLAAGLAVAALRADPPRREWAYPEAPRGSVVDNYHGVAVADPYRWLEDIDSPQTRAWVAAENRLTDGLLASLPSRPKYHALLEKLWNFPRYGLPFKEAGRVFFTRNNGLQNQAVLFVQDGPGRPERVLLDPNTLSADGTVALAALDVSHDGRRLAYSTAAAGSDWNEIHVRSVDTGRDTPDLIRWVKFSEASWTRDGRGFYYSRFDEPAPTGARAGATFGALTNEKVYYHLLGTPQASDRLILAMPSEPKWMLNTSVTEDGRYAVVTVERGDMDFNLVKVADLGDPLAPKVDARPVDIVGQWNARYSVIGNVGPVLYLHTNLGAARWRIVAVDLRSPSPANWRTVVPEGTDTIDGAALVGGRLAVLTMHDASSRILLHGLDGRSLGGIPLPGLGDVAGISGRADDPEFFFSFTSITSPTTDFRYDVSKGALAAFHPPPLSFDPSVYDTREVFARSRDGTLVPLFLVSRRGAPRDGARPTLLYAYGGFNISMKPYFSVTNVAWLESGGTFAMACLRGGGEYGEAWHKAGNRERKQHVFDDFIGAAQWLFDNKVTSPAHLAIRGGSNGGLLIGATVNERPDLCRVALPAVGVMDMLRFQKFTIGYAWVFEYGSSDDPAMFPYLRAYSPLHTVRAGAAYPAVLVTTGDHDDRVFPAHSFKYTAAMQAGVANGPGALPVVIRIETRAGHGAGKPTSKAIDEAADTLAFTAHFLGME